MAKLSQVVLQSGNRLGLSVEPGQSIAFGDRNGYLVQITPAKKDRGNERIVTLIRHGSSDKDSTIRDTLGTVDFASLGIEPKDIGSGDGFVTYDLNRGFVRGPDADSVVRAFERVFATVTASCDPLPAVCCSCGEAYTGDPMLVDGMVDRLCASCVEEIHQAAAEAQVAYDAIPVDLPFAMVTATILAIVGAVAWAAIAIATERMFWFLAIGIGVVVGKVTSKAAGKNAPVVQVLVGVSTIASVLLGQIMVVGFLAHQAAARDNLVVDWIKFLQAVPELLIRSGSDTLFALGGGLLGAVYAARLASKPKIKGMVGS